MNPNFQRLMNEATRLTRAGDLRGATAVIQSALAGHGPAGFPTAPLTGDASGDADAFVIDVEAREVHELRKARVVTPQVAAAAPATGASLAASFARAAAPETAPAPTPPQAERFVAGSHGDAAGRRDYKLYVPPGAGDRPRPLIVMLHGCTQHPDDFAAGTAMNELARDAGCYVLYPAQSPKMNPQRCWNWFKHTHQRRGRGEPALIAAMTREVMRQHRVDPARVYVAGLSAGGAMAAILGETYPDLYVAVGVHSGLAAGAASDLPSALAAMQGGGRGQVRGGADVALPTIVFHGDADTTVHPANADQVVAAVVGTGATVESHRLPAGAGRASTRRVQRGRDGRVVAEHWVVHGAPHAWSGGRPGGSYTDARGPDASAEMLRFFLERSRAAAEPAHEPQAA
jgi:poly(hydroxyalkanoate) depolymerase family esterase